MSLINSVGYGGPLDTQAYTAGQTVGSTPRNETRFGFIAYRNVPVTIVAVL